MAHSYGAAVALIAAVSQPRGISALALHEPTLFAVLDAESPSPNDADGIRGAVAGAAAAVDAADLFAAAECVINFWMGKGTWARTPESRKGHQRSRVGRLLTRVLPQVLVVEFNGMAHIGPITHSEAVNDAIIRFLQRG